jgi:uncharacterized membrane protein YphA (DoxX/SURF4 family)
MSKTTRIISMVLKVLVALMFVMSAVMKLMHSQQIVDGFNKVGLGSFITLIGLTELVSAILFLIPMTSRIGFLLMTAYLGGAIVIQMASGQPVYASAGTQVFLWIAMFLADKHMFVKTSGEQKPA